LKGPKKFKKGQLDDFFAQANLDTVEKAELNNFADALIQVFKKGYDYQRPSRSIGDSSIDESSCVYKP